jgi:hypothetical protein
VIKVLNEVSKLEGDKKDKDVKAFSDVIHDIKKLANNADKTVDTLIKADENWFFSSFIKLFK